MPNPNTRNVFLWENFGPYHIDRLCAVSEHNADTANVIGIELSSKSAAYAWEREDGAQFSRITLVKDGPHFFERPKFWQFVTLFLTTYKLRRAHFFFCHYEQPAVFLTALVLRLLGRRVFIMNDMKYADFKRTIPREIIKTLFHAPYIGAIAAGRRSADYFRFMGISEDRIHLGYGTVSLARLDSYLQSGREPVYQDRPFIVVARFMPMKNLFRILEAYQLYREATSKPRKLHLCGSGPLDDALRDSVKRLQLQDDVIFRGYLNAPDVTRAIAESLCLILYSTQETFGNVIIEALALGVPVIASPICGATDEFLKSGVNGFLVEPDNVEGLANFMKHIDGPEEQWLKLSSECRKLRPMIDIQNFVESVSRCVHHIPAQTKEEQP